MEVVANGAVNEDLADNVRPTRLSCGFTEPSCSDSLSSVIKIESIITDPSHGLGLAGAIQRLNH